MCLALRIALAISLASPGVALADAICRDAHTDDYSSVVLGVASPAFLLTQGCNQDPLHLRPRPPQLAIRWSDSSDNLPGEPPGGTSSPEAAPSIPDSTPKECTSVTVLFELDRAVLTPVAKALLDGVKEGARVSITGYTCGLGSSARNLGLSQRRADAVAAYLQGRGILAERVEGKGECCPASERLELNRRVEIQSIQAKE